MNVAGVTQKRTAVEEFRLSACWLVHLKENKVLWLVVKSRTFDSSSR